MASSIFFSRPLRIPSPVLAILSRKVRPKGSSALGLAPPAVNACEFAPVLAAPKAPPAAPPPVPPLPLPEPESCPPDANAPVAPPTPLAEDPPLPFVSALETPPCVAELPGSPGVEVASTLVCVPLKSIALASVVAEIVRLEAAPPVASPVPAP